MTLWRCEVQECAYCGEDHEWVIEVLVGGCMSVMVCSGCYTDEETVEKEVWEALNGYCIVTEGED